MSITTILAIWGAVISTAALTWNIIRGLQDRRCLKVKAEIANIMPGDPNKYYFCITMTNAGRRPVNIVGCGGSRIKEGEGLKNFLMITRDLPKMLKEGERHTEYSDDLSIFF